MNIEVKNIKYAAYLSEETNAFTADVYINGTKAAYAKNDGHGGMTNVQPYTVGLRPLVAQAEEYCKNLPPHHSPSLGDGDRAMDLDMSLDFFVDLKIDEFVNKKEAVRIAKSMDKKCLTKIIVMKKEDAEALRRGELPKGNMGYRQWGWGKKPLAQIESGKLKASVLQIKNSLEDFEVIFNTNLPQ